MYQTAGLLKKIIVFCKNRVVCLNHSYIINHSRKFGSLSSSNISATFSPHGVSTFAVTKGIYPVRLEYQTRSMSLISGVSPDEEAKLTQAAKELALDESLLLPIEDRPAHYANALAFYNSIGAPKTVCAPMVNQSHLPFRTLVRRYGTDLCYTPMVHAATYVRNPKTRQRMFGTDEADRPVFAQCCGDDPDAIVAAAALFQDKVDAIDMNFGCPQQIAKRGHYGAFLLDEPQLVQRIVRSLHDKLKIPVTVKIRILLNDPSGYKTVAFARALQDCGASVLTIHGRTRENLKQRIGPSDTSIIRRIKAALTIPVFANGGIGTFEDVRRTFVETGVDGVMSSEALLNWPALFASEHPKPDLHALVRRAQRRLGLRVTQPGFEHEKDELGMESKEGSEAFEDARTPSNSVVCMPNAVEMAHELIELSYKYPAYESCIRPHLFKILFRELAIHTDVRRYLGGVPAMLRLVPRQLRKAQCIAFARHLRFPELPLIQTVPIFAADGSISYTAYVGKLSTSDGESGCDEDSKDELTPCNPCGEADENKEGSGVDVESLPKDANGDPIVTEGMPIPKGMSKSQFKKLCRKNSSVPSFHRTGDQATAVHISDTELDLSDENVARILDESNPLSTVITDGSSPAEMKRIMRSQEFYMFLDRLYSQCSWWYVRHLTRKDWTGRMDTSSVRCLESVIKALATSATSSHLYSEIASGKLAVSTIATSIREQAEALAAETSGASASTEVSSSLDLEVDGQTKRSNPMENESVKKVRSE